MCRILPYLCLFSVCLLIHVTSEDISDDTLTAITKSEQSSSTSPSITSTVKPTNNTCETHYNNCKECVANSDCYYCDSNKECHKNLGKAIVDGQCESGHAFFGTCKASVKVLAIIIGVLGGIVLLIITCVCCYCCCKKRGMKLSKDDIKWARQREERKEIAAERRRERAERTEEIRKKYGIVKDSNPYQKFDA